MYTQKKYLYMADKQSKSLKLKQTTLTMLFILDKEGSMKGSKKSKKGKARM